MEAQNSNEIPTRSVFLNRSAVAFNTFNTIIGVGIITLPYTVLLGGFFFVLFAMTFCVLLIFYTSALMVNASLKNANIQTYAELCNAAYGAGLKYYLSFIMFLQMFGFISVYAITLRKQFENVIADITGETFLYGKAVLAGVMVVVVLLSIPKKITKMSIPSFISLACVLLMIFVSIARAPFYHKALSEMTPERMIENEKSLHIDRALWACNPDKEEAKLKEWPALNVTNLNVLSDSLQKKGVCNNVRWGVVSKKITEIGEKPKIQNPQEGVETWADVARYEHPRYLYDKFSLNAAGRKKRNFSLLAFAKIRAFIVFGTIASAFVYQQASIKNFQSLENKSEKEFVKVTGTAFVLVFVCCVALALAGYFGQEYQVGSFVFEKMKMRYYRPGQHDYVTITARMALIFSIILTYPLQFFYGRVNLNILICMIMRKFFKWEGDEQNAPRKVFYFSTLIMWVLSTLIGLFLEKAAILFSVVGALFGGQMIYIFPIICWYSLNGGFKTVIKQSYKGNLKEKFFKIFLPVFVLIFGVITTISSSLISFLELANVL